MHPRQRAAQRQRQPVLDAVGNTDACGFFDLLTGPRMLERIEALLPEHRERVFPPTETLSMFLVQALSADGSCRQAVDEAAVKRLLAGLPPHSTNTSAYCQARARLPMSLIATLARQTGAMIAAAAPSWWHWRGRPVRLVDGATVTLSDTAANQAAYPQPSGQKPAWGFPSVASWRCCAWAAVPCWMRSAVLAKARAATSSRCCANCSIP